MSQEHSIYQGPICDTHMHLWDLDSEPHGNRYGWLKGPNQAKTHFGGNEDTFNGIRKTYLLPNYLEDNKHHKVEKVVHVQAECDNAKGETMWLQEISDKYGAPNGIVAFANLGDPNVEELLQFHAKHKVVRGIRQLLNWHDDPKFRLAERPDWVKDPQWKKGFALLAKYNLSFDLHLWPTQVQDAIEVLKENPNIQVIVDHTGLPFGYLDPSEKALNLWKSELKKLAELPNVVLKISGIAMTHHTVTTEVFRPIVQYAIETFGVDRCMFGSNFPVDKMNTTYENLFNVYKECVSHLSPDEQRKVFYENAIRVYRLQ